MSSAVHRILTSSASIPLSQNTAPVLEFNCLYTHDVRRKQKRWQDGFLRYHTFNKRVMVYDVPRNFIGDMHWSAGQALQEGDEVMLEKDGVMVEVAESVGKTETDLTELRMSAKKGKGGNGQDGSSPMRGSGRGGNIETPSRSMAPPAARAASSYVAGQGQPKHRSLNALLGTPKGPIGKAALPSKSPFEERQRGAENEQWEQGRPPKRQRTEPWSVTRTTAVATPSRPQPSKEVPLWARTSDARKAASAKARKQKSARPAGQQALDTREVIVLSDDHENSATTFLPGFSSDGLAPPSSPQEKQPKPAAKKTAARSSSPAFQTQAAQQNDTTVKAKKHGITKSTVAKEGDSGQRRTGVLSEASVDRPSVPIAPPFLPPSTEQGQTLRISSTVPKKRTLACLDANAVTYQGSESEQSTAIAKPKRKSQREQLEERLAKQKAKAKEKRDGDLNDLVDDIEATDTVPVVTTAEVQTNSELSRMDRMLESAPPESPATEPNHARGRRTQRVLSEEEAVPARSRQGKPFQRVASEHGTAASTSISAKPKRITGAPVRFTPSPTRRGEMKDAQKGPGPEKTTLASPEDQAARTMGAETHGKPRKGIGRREIRKSASACFPTMLNTSANGTDTVLLRRPFQAPMPPMMPKPAPTEMEVGPWSREAFDLFDWRPPNWDEEAWRVKRDPTA